MMIKYLYSLFQIIRIYDFVIIIIVYVCVYTRVVLDGLCVLGETGNTSLAYVRRTIDSALYHGRFIHLRGGMASVESCSLFL